MEIIALLVTWYATKLYYTRNPKLSITNSDPDMVHATCAKCAQTLYLHVDNLRTPFYCLACK